MEIASSQNASGHHPGLKSGWSFPALNALALGPVVVVLSWAGLYAEETGSALKGIEMALLAAGIWLGYTADRWCDCCKNQNPREARHQWFWNYRQTILPVWLVVLLAAVVGAQSTLTPASLLTGIGLAGLAFLYTLANSGNYLSWQAKALKTAFLLSLAVILFSLDKKENPLELIWLPLIPLFASNCMLVNAWEPFGSEKEKNQKRVWGLGFSILAFLSFLLLISITSLIWVLPGVLAAISLITISFWRPAPAYHSAGGFFADLVLFFPPIGALFL